MQYVRITRDVYNKTELFPLKAMKYPIYACMSKLNQGYILQVLRDMLKEEFGKKP